MATLRMKAVVSHAPPVDEPAQRTPRPAPSIRVTIMHALILDDEAAIGRVICRVARSVGFTAEAVSDAADFQRQYSREQPDIVLLDLQIGGDDGIAQLRFLSEQGYPHSVILMSGYDERVLSSGERLGRDLGLHILTSLTKPFGAKELAAVFEQLVARSTHSNAAPPR
jgi:two-component system OmpR family response regulator